MFIKIPENIRRVLDTLQAAGFEAYIVGGCVRDALMGVQPHDFDVTTSATPQETERVFEGYRVIETGLKHGTVTVLSGGEPVEITTFRVDGEYLDGRHPESVSFTRCIEDDLSRRDFTINGMAYSPKLGFVDLFGGQEDLARGIIRCIGSPEKRFGEDALRILRALRFSSVLGFAIEENTARAVREGRGALAKVSVERIFAELKKLLCGKDAQRVLLEFPEVFAQIIPELAVQIGFEQGSRFHDRTLWEHTAAAVGAAECDVGLRLAMLFHDIGKPQRRTFGEDGEAHYYGHPEDSAIIADRVLRSMNCDNATRERVCRIVRFHEIPVEKSAKYIRRALAKHGLDGFRDIMLAHIADDSAKAPIGQERIPQTREAIRLAEEIMAQKPCLSIKELAINGGDLAGIIPPSPKLGRLLRKLTEEVIDEKLPNEREALLKRAAELAAKNGADK